MQRRIVTFVGDVQGVGFRQTTVETAARFTVTGTVRNLSTGDVELIGEGAADELDRFIAAIEKRMARYVRKVHFRIEAATAQFDGFTICR